MKLYTEEQLTKLTSVAYVAGQNNNTFIYGDEFLKLTPIELPSDEEIEKQSKYWNETTNPDMWTFKLAWKAGAKWMRDKIGGNK